MTEKDQVWRNLGARAKAMHIQKILGNDLSGFDSILEVGCGSGAVIEQLLSLGLKGKIAGCDFSLQLSAIEKLRAKNPSLNFVEFDGETIPFDDESFDFVYATHVLEHVLEPRRFLKELRRVSRGQIFIEVPCEVKILSNIEKLQPSLDIGHINVYSPLSLQLLLETTGFRVQKLEVFDHSYDVLLHESRRPIHSRIRQLARMAALRVAPKLAPYLFTYHCAALCEVEPLTTIDG